MARKERDQKVYGSISTYWDKGKRNKEIRVNELAHILSNVKFVPDKIGALKAAEISQLAKKFMETTQELVTMKKFSNPIENENSMVIDKRVFDWIIGPDTGVSSSTIVHVLSGLPWTMSEFKPDIPYDPWDFARCYRLLEIIPEWKERLHEVADKYPSWKLIIENWKTLEIYYLSPGAELNPGFSDKMREIYDESNKI